MKNSKLVSIKLNLVPNTRLRENETTYNNLIVESPAINANANNNNNLNNQNREIINPIQLNNEFSNLNGYSNELSNNAESESGYLNRNFESHLDEIFDNLTYLITTEKYNLY